MLKLTVARTLQRHNIENSKQIFLEEELRGLNTNFHIHVSMSDLYISQPGVPILLQENMCSALCTNPGAFPFLGIKKSNFRCNVDEQPPPEQAV